MCEYRKNTINNNMILFFTQDIIFRFNHKRRYSKFFNELASTYNKRLNDVNFIFCSDDYLLNINKRFLRHDYCTDVITFDNSSPISFDQISGDIFISIETVRFNAKEYGASSFKEELLRVMAHGLLHLIGYNDGTSKEKTLMRQQEDAVLLQYNKQFNDY